LQLLVYSFLLGSCRRAGESKRVPSSLCVLRTLLFTCSDPSFPPGASLTGCTGTYTLPGSAQYQVRGVVTPRMNFDDYPQAMLTLFISSTNVGWSDTMDALAGITRPGLAPRRGASYWNAYFMVVFVAIARLVLLNLLRLCFGRIIRF